MTDDDDRTKRTHHDKENQNDARDNNDEDESSTGTHPTDRGSVLRPPDEVQKIRMQTQEATARVRNWRIIVTIALIATGAAVVAATYLLLVKQEHDNFHVVFVQFAGTVGDAALEFQRDLRASLHHLAETISLSADLIGEGTPTWPFFLAPKFEAYAADYRAISGAEFVGISNIVPQGQRDEYTSYIASVYEDAVKESHMISYGNLDFLDTDTSNYMPYFLKKTEDGFVEDDERDMYFVRNIQSPPSRQYGPPINWNVASEDMARRNMDAMLILKNRTIMSEVRPFTALPDDEHAGYHDEDEVDNPHCFAFHPIHRTPGDGTSGIVAVLTTAIAFDASMKGLLPDNVHGIYTVVSNTCNQTFSYLINGKKAIFQGVTDLHDHQYDDMEVHVDLSLFQNALFQSTPGHCMYSLNIYPTEAFEQDYMTNTPIVFAGVVAAAFAMVLLISIVYDIMVMRRNELMIANTAKSNAILHSMIPDHLRDRLLNFEQQGNANPRQQEKKETNNLSSFLHDGNNRGIMEDTEHTTISTPLADLYLDTTVLQADIAGFTAWASVREPTQVFILLENLFQCFDKVATKRRIFKVETVGDSYTAVCGLPDPRNDHAVAMARFARNIMVKMHLLVKELEVTLGPDTGDLSLRVGIHSGPVTAGVLRGDKCRFQLFGDTVNVCAKLESTGYPNRIQCSKETADLIVKSGKGAWVHKRADPISLSGKGVIEAYWVAVKGERAGSLQSGLSSQVDSTNAEANRAWNEPFPPGIDERTQRLIDWNVEMLLRLLKEIAAQRASQGLRRASLGTVPLSRSSHDETKQSDEVKKCEQTIPLEEVQEIITLPEFDFDASRTQRDPKQMEIPHNVISQLHQYVTAIAGLYKPNPFHNFDHASHVVMSVTKLMSRIVAPNQLDGLVEDGSDHRRNTAASLHDHTYGITSDPLTQFACAYSALIHDVDHDGVPNAQLVKEGVPIAKKYKNRSVAEQNSLDISWELLMRPEYDALRAFLLPTKEEYERFRQLVVNSLMSTDIVDPELKVLRNARWDKAFKKDESDNSSNHGDSKRDEINRKATIVIEHIIQASDISHTMQHWHVYIKWNQHFYDENYVAYLNGRMDKNPAEFWYRGEFGFFDYYIIPLTKKLKECGVFGVSSGEYLNYAVKNRAEWENHGEEVVNRMIEEARKKYGVKGPDGQIIKTGNESTTSFQNALDIVPSPQENSKKMAPLMPLEDTPKPAPRKSPLIFDIETEIEV